MLQSMTGYGESRCLLGKNELNIKIISLNSRYLETSFNIPTYLDSIRAELEREIKKIFKRGKITVKMEIDEKEEEIFERIHDFINKSSEYFKKKAIITEGVPFVLYFDLSKLNLVRHRSWESLNTLQKRAIKRCFKEALLKVLEMRKIEGEKTEKFLRERLELIAKKLNIINRMKKKERIEAEKLYKSKGIEDSEMLSALLLKLDVSEEIERLKSHIKYFKQILRQKGDEKGKKLDFLSQEITRELTTLGSKTHKPEIVHEVILLKEEIEKIREQLRNIQ